MRAKQELQSLRKQNTTLDSEYHEQEKLINQMRTKLAVLEQEVKDKENLIAKSSDLLGSEQDQKVYCINNTVQANIFLLLKLCFPIKICYAEIFFIASRKI